MALLKPLIYKSVGCSMPLTKYRSLDKIRHIFQYVDNILTDGWPFLCGNEFTIDDLSFPALVGTILCPVWDGTYLVSIEEFPWKHIMRMYETENTIREAYNEDV